MDGRSFALIFNYPLQNHSKKEEEMGKSVIIQNQNLVMNRKSVRLKIKRDYFKLFFIFNVIFYLLGFILFTDYWKSIWNLVLLAGTLISGGLFLRYRHSYIKISKKPNLFQLVLKMQNEEENIGTLVCPHCGATFQDYVNIADLNSIIIPNFCPNCGSSFKI